MMRMGTYSLRIVDTRVGIYPWRVSYVLYVLLRILIADDTMRYQQRQCARRDTLSPLGVLNVYQVRDWDFLGWPLWYGGAATSKRA